MQTSTARIVLVPLTLAALVACADSAPPPAPDLEAGALSPNDTYIVVLKDGGDPEAVAAAVGVTPGHVYRHALKGFAAALPPQAIDALRRRADVRFVEADRLHQASIVPGSTGIDRIDVDLNPWITGAPVDVDVAVIDTGVDHLHPWLTVVARVDCARWAGCRDGGSDGAGHGTHVAGTIAGTAGVGVAPGARIHAVRVLGNSGSGYTSWIIAGIDWVTARAGQIEVANMSLGGPGGDDTDGGDCEDSTDAEHLAICRSVNAGVVYVVAAGNEADDAENHTPAAYDEVITVSALADFDGAPGGHTDTSVQFQDCTETTDDSVACFSNYGHDVDIMAPGVNIRSAYPGNRVAISSGTSMASPHVAGLAALYLAQHPKPTNKDGVRNVRTAILGAGLAIGSDCGLDVEDNADWTHTEPIAYANAGIFGGTGGSCDSGTCASDDDCDDDDVCNGDETCGAGDLCDAGTAPTCDDGDACTTDGCDAATGCTTAPISCNDNNACTTDSCDPATGCSSVTTITCNDNSTCTDDSCNAANGSCVFTPNGSCGGGTCSPNAAVCSANSDCCSNRCKSGRCKGN